MDTHVKINGAGKFLNTDFTVSALRLFRVRMNEVADYKSFKGAEGLCIIKLIRTTSDMIEYKDIGIRFSMTDSTTMTPKIKVMEYNKNNKIYMDYKIKVIGDFAYFDVKGRQQYDMITYQIVYAKNPTFIENMMIEIPIADYNDDITNVVSVYYPSSGSFDNPTITWGSGLQASTHTHHRPFLVSVLDDSYMLLSNWIKVLVDAPADKWFMQLSKGSYNKTTQFLVDTISGVDYTTATFTKTPFSIATNGEIKSLKPISEGSYLYFNNIIQYKDIQ
jgi:hypothetical protein